MPIIALSDEVIANLATPPNEDGQRVVLYWDISLPKFGVRVGHTGKKTFLCYAGPRSNRKSVTLGNAEYTLYETAKLQALRILESTSTSAIPEKQASFKATAGSFWISELPGRLFPWAVFWTHPTLGHWHHQVAAFRDKARAENYIIAETGTLLPDFSPPDLTERPPIDAPPVSKTVIRPEPKTHKAHRLAFKQGRYWQYQRAIPRELRRFFDGQTAIWRHIPTKTPSSGIDALVAVWAKQDDEQFQRLRDEHGLPATINTREAPPSFWPAEKARHNYPHHSGGRRYQMWIPERLRHLFSGKMWIIRYISSHVSPVGREALVAKWANEDKAHFARLKDQGLEEQSAPPEKSAATNRLARIVLEKIDELYVQYPTGIALADVERELGTSSTAALRGAITWLHRRGDVQWVYTHNADRKYLFPKGAQIPKRSLSARARLTLQTIAAMAKMRGLPMTVGRQELAKAADIPYNTAYHCARVIAKKGYITIDETYAGLDGLRITHIDAPAEFTPRAVLNMRHAHG